MAKIRVYRYDDQDYAEGEPLLPRGDWFHTLTDHQKIVENAIRASLADRRNARSTSLCTWENKEVAERLWRLSGKKYLYELEVDEADIHYRGDLNFYSAAESATKSGKSLEDAVRKYCAGETAGPPFTEPRIEILVSKAVVCRKL